MTLECRIFMGYFSNKEVQHHLNQSSLWQEAKILKDSLIEIKWGKKDYIGFFIPAFLTLVQIKQKEQEIKMKMEEFCPKLNLDKYPIQLFSQILIS